jgi:hypothetical protein
MASERLGRGDNGHLSFLLVCALAALALTLNRLDVAVEKHD